MKQNTVKQNDKAMNMKEMDKRQCLQHVLDVFDSTMALEANRERSTILNELSSFSTEELRSALDYIKNSKQV